MAYTVDDLSMSIQTGQIFDAAAPSCKALVNKRRLSKTALGLAIRLGQDVAARVLLENGADPNQLSCDSYGFFHPPLIIACQLRRVQIAHLLLRFGASADCSDVFGHRAVWIATKSRCKAMLQLLVDHGALVNCCGGAHWRMCALYYACRHAPHSGLAEMLICNGHATSCCADDQGRDALFWSLTNNQIALAMLMLDCGSRLGPNHRQLIARKFSTENATLPLCLGRAQMDFLRSCRDGRQFAPRTLKSACRRAFRACIAQRTPGANLRLLVEGLRLPATIKSYLMYGSTRVDVPLALNQFR